jgi:hypothetical protein
MTRVAQAIVAGLVLLGIALLAGVSSNRAFQVDEVEHLHAAYHLRAGRALYGEVWQVHMPLLYGLLAPLVDVDDPRGSYHRARSMLVVLLLATVYLAARSAALLARSGLARSGLARSATSPQNGDPAGLLAGSLAAALLLLHTTFVERGMEVRADGPLALCVVAALRLELSAGRRRSWTALASGALLGLAFLLTQKAVFATAAFGALWLVRAVRTRQPSLVVLPFLGWCAPVGVAVTAIAAQGGLEEFWRDAILGASAAVGRDEARLAFSPLGFLLQEGQRNVAFWALALFGLAVALAAALRGSPRSTGAPPRDAQLGGAVCVAAAFLAVALLGSLWLQPFPWPYVHVSVLPPLVVVAAAGLARVLASQPVEQRGLAWPLAALWLFLQLATAAPRLLAKSVPDHGSAGQEHQLALLDEVQRVTAAEDPVFDLAGLYFRPDGYPAYALSGDLFRLYRSGGLPPMVPALRERGTVAFIFNYRVGWLRGEEQAFLHERFAHYAGNLFLLGRELGGLPAGVDVPFEVLRAKRFRYDGPQRALLVNGQPFEAGELARGVHLLRLQHRVDDARLILDAPEPRPSRTPPKTLYVHFD